MFTKKRKKDKSFILPEKEFFISPNKIDPLLDGKSDPIMYYYKPIVGKLYRHRIQQGLNLLSAPYKTILDFGYGSGLLFPTLDKLCAKLVGIDIESEPAEVLEQLSKINIKAELYNEDILDVKHLDNSIDLIVAFSVFEHIKSPDLILEKMTKMLKPEGQLLVGMPRVDKIMERMFALIGFNDINTHHVTSHKDFLSVADKYFELKKIEHMPSFLPSFAGLYYNMLFKKR